MITNAPIRWGRSLLLGILAAVDLAVCSPVWMLAPMGGPVPFTLFWLLITSPFLISKSANTAKDGGGTGGDRNSEAEQTKECRERGGEITAGVGLEP